MLCTYTMYDYVIIYIACNNDLIPENSPNYHTYIATANISRNFSFTKH